MSRRVSKGLRPVCLLILAGTTLSQELDTAQIGQLRGFGNGGEFGTSLASSASRLLVGAPLARNSANIEAGATHVFEPGATGWTETAKLTASDGVAHDRFGSAVAMSGARLAIGARLHDVAGIPDRGAAYVFVRCGSQWIEQAKLVDLPQDDSRYFGSSLDLDGGTLAIGTFDHQCGLQAGAVAIFVADDAGTPADPCDDTWTLQAKIRAADCGAGEMFGFAFDLQGDRLVVGAPHHPGAAYVFERTAGTWTQTASFAAPDTVDGDRFGWAVALRGATIVVGAPYDFALEIREGSAHVFHLRAGTWQHEQQLGIPDAHSYDQLGTSIDLAGDTLLVGAPGHKAAIVFRESSGRWTQVEALLSLDGGLFGDFGSTVALEQGWFAVAAPGDDLVGGSVTLFGELQGSWTLYGPGDGTQVDCPCQRNSTVGLDAGCWNYCGAAARLAPDGSDSASLDSFLLVASGACPGRPALLFSGSTPTAGTAFGGGLLVVAPPFTRHGLRIADIFGGARWGPGLATAHGWSAGTSRHFQAWYRDPDSICLVGTHFAEWNTSIGVSVTLAP